MHLEIVSSKSTNLFILEGFQKCLIPELNIYNQAYLTLKSPLSLTNKIHKETNSELGFEFNIDGELKGKAIALIDTYNKNLSNEERGNLMPVLAESLNILLGNTLSRLDAEIDHMTLLSPPKEIALEETFSIKKSFDLKINLNYLFEYKDIPYNLRLYYLINKEQFREVNV